MTELDRQVADYKRRADAGESISQADAVWLLNELIYERDHSGVGVPEGEHGDLPRRATE